MLDDEILVWLISGEFVVLVVLVVYLFEMFSCEWLIVLVWGCEYDVFDCSIDVMVLCLCCCIEDDLC